MKLLHSFIPDPHVEIVCGWMNLFCLWWNIHTGPTDSRNLMLYVTNKIWSCHSQIITRTQHTWIWNRDPKGTLHLIFAAGKTRSVTAWDWWTWFWAATVWIWVNHMRIGGAPCDRRSSTRDGQKHFMIIITEQNTRESAISKDIMTFPLISKLLITIVYYAQPKRKVLQKSDHIQEYKRLK